MSRTRAYEGEGITVSYELQRCIHAAECVKGLPTVFDPNKRPWIDPTQAGADALAAVVERCPTGALTYERTDGGAQESAPAEARVELVPDGPIHVHGRLELKQPDGAVHWAGNRAALCRCGQSVNKPFCDNTHKNVGFKSE